VTAYLPDTENPTGYTQTLERRVDGELRRSYTLGHDVLAQAETVAQGALLPGEPVVFLHEKKEGRESLLRGLGDEGRTGPCRDGFVTPWAGWWTTC
jgi:hypothetical protein